MSRPARRGTSARRGLSARWGSAAVLVGWLLALAGALLPWTSNERSGHRQLLEMGDRHPAVVIAYAVGFAALSVALLLTALGSSPLAALLPAVAAAAVMVVVVLVTPRPDTLWDGVDSTGRSVGGSYPTVLSFGAAAAVLGAAVVVIATGVRARAGRTRACRARPGPAGAGRAGPRVGGP